MTALKLSQFGGMIPAWDERLLPETQAATSVNCYLLGGNLIGWRQPKLLYQLKSSTSKYAYRLPNRDSNNTGITAVDSFWMEFDDADTTVMRTPVVDDSFQRYYFASPSQPPKYNTYDRILNGDHPWLLGVPASACPPGVTVTGGGDIVQFGADHVKLGVSAIDFRPPNEIFLIPIVPDGTLLMQTVNFMPATTDAAVNFHAVVYDDLGGIPNNLLSIGDEVTGVVAGVEATSTFQNSISVISNHPYWIGIAHDIELDVRVADDSQPNGVSFFNTYSNGPPDNALGVGGAAGQIWQMWSDLLGSTVFTARSYVYTWVTAYGEEGPPSEPSVVNGWSNGIWHISVFTPLPEDMGTDRNITHTRIYRTISDQYGSSTYFFVAEIPVAQATYEDTASDATVALNSQMESLYWFGPPEDLKAIVPVPNGMAVGFKANEIWFAEAYRPHAWPPNYVLTTEFPIVGVGVCGQSIVVCTQGSPYLVTGINPATMALTKLNLPEPCIHHGSIVATDTTVFYVSKNGLVQVSQSGAGGNVTEGWVSREKWQKLVPQKFIRAVKHATSYFAFGTVQGADTSVARTGFTIELSGQDQTSFSIWPQAGGHRLGFSEMVAPNELDIDNVLLDPWTGVCLLIQGGAIWQYDFTDQSPVITPYKWRSKVFQQSSRKNFQAMRCFFSVPNTTPSQVDRNVDEPQPQLGANQYGIIRAYVDGELWTTRELRSSGELLRIYSGIKGEQWQFEIEGRVNVSNLQIATSVKELGTI